MRHLIVLFIVCVFLFAAGCGDDGSVGVYDFGGISIIHDSGLEARFVNPIAGSVQEGKIATVIEIDPGTTFDFSTVRYAYIVIDGMLDFTSLPFIYVGGVLPTNNSINIDLNTFNLPNGVHTIQPWLRASIAGELKYIIGEMIQISVSNEFVLIHEVADPEGDWHGPSGDLFMPLGGGTDGTYLDDLHDITNVIVNAAGGNFELLLNMKLISTAWSPGNGFDHVSFHIYLNDPGKTGVTDYLPRQKAGVPGALGDWDYQIVCDGWTRNIYGTEGASANDFGDSVGSLEVGVVPGTTTVRFLVFANAIGNPESLNGWKIYISNFDMDGLSGTMRAVILNGSGHCIRSTNAAMFSSGLYTGALIMDDVPTFTLSY